MRVECESCRELAVATVAIAGGVVLVTCSACAAVARVTPLDAPVAQELALCPKCGAQRRSPPEPLACAGCGLMTERMAAYAAAREAAVAESVRTAWDHAVERWDEPARHDALLQAVAAHGAYAWAAGRYRDAARMRAGDPIGPRQLDRLRRAAEATLLASAAARPDSVVTPYRATMTILAMMIVAIIAGLLYAVVSRGATATDTAGRVTPAAPLGGVAPRPTDPGTR